MEEINSNYYLGFSHLLIKSDEKDDSIVYLEASNEVPDSDDEVVLMKALSDQAENFLKRGVLSWDHLHKSEKNPKYIIGEPLDVRFGDNNNTIVKGRLYKEKEYAQEVMKMAKSNSTRLGASIGGNIVSKSKTLDKVTNRLIPVINKLIWDEVAITYKPVNQDTMGKCGYYDFGMFTKSFKLDPNGAIEKALMAGNGVNAGAFTGGRALIGEVTNKKMVNRNFWKGVIGNIADGKILSYADLQKHLVSAGVPSNDIGVIATIVAENVDSMTEKFKVSQ